MNEIENKLEEIRTMSRYENDLINHRLGWLSAFQGLLFAALAFAWGKSAVFLLSMVISIVGILVSLSIGLATRKANKAIVNLQRRFDEIRPKGYRGPDVEGSRSGKDKLDWLLPGSFIPWIFGVSWFCIVLLRLINRG